MKLQKSTNSYSVCRLLCSLTCKFTTSVISSDFVCSKQAWVFIAFYSARCIGTNCARLWRMHRWIHIKFCRGNTNTDVCVVTLLASIQHYVHIHKHAHHNYTLILSIHTQLCTQHHTLQRNIASAWPAGDPNRNNHWKNVTLGAMLLSPTLINQRTSQDFIDAIRDTRSRIDSCNNKPTQNVIQIGNRWSYFIPILLAVPGHWERPVQDLCIRDCRRVSSDPFVPMQYPVFPHHGSRTGDDDVWSGRTGCGDSRYWTPG